MHLQPLPSSWTFRRLPDSPFQPALVPGSVHLDLLRLHQIPDPFFADHEKQVFWVAESDWEYACTFTSDPALLSEDRVFLFAAGLDTLAELSLNGHPLAATDNMFRSYRWEVKDRLLPGENRLSIIFRSPVRYITEKFTSRPLTCGTESIPGGTYLRKAACHFGWDWGPKLPSIGIWKEIRLEGRSTARLADVHLRQRHTDGRVTLQAGIQIERWRSGDLTARLEVTAPDGQVLSSDTIIAGAKGQLALEIPDPHLWWPNGCGGQPLYRVQVALLERGLPLDEQRFTVGLRTLELRRQPDEWGESFTFVVNGVPIFAKGANWIPPDTFPNRVTGASLEFLVASAASANMNMLRVWGGGYYEDETFYDLCDRYGILVWQDFMFACGIYPLGDPAFLANLRAETQEVVRRLRHRACLALWCGNNEMEQGWVDWAWSRPENRQAKAEYRRYFYRDLPAQVAAEDPDHAYWPSSPSSGVAFEKPNDATRGDAHYWDVWHGRKPFSAYRQQYPRFMSEFGFQSLPPLSTIQTFAAPADLNLTSYVMEHHQRSGVGNELILSQLAAHFRIPRDFDNLAYVSMLLQAEGIRYGVEHWRRSMQRVSGTLIWQLDDNWPVISWSSIDYYGRWKALHYAARRFFAPLLLSVELHGRQVALHLSSDRRDPQPATLSWSLQTVDGRILQSASRDLVVLPLASSPVVDLDLTGILAAQDLRRVVFCCELSVEGSPASSQVVPFVPDKHLELEDPCPEIQVEQSGDRLQVRVKVHSLARFIELRFDRADVVFSDNYFSLPAGSERTVDCPLPPGWTLDQARESLHVRTLFDSY